MLALRERSEFVATLCATAQHRELLDEGLAVFGLRPDHDLDVMRESQPLEEVTGRLITGLGALLRRDPVDLVLVQGDTASAFVGALAAFFHRIPVGHVEAGLRSGNRYRPFPEDVLRRMVSQIATLHFAPTRRAADNIFLEQPYPDAEVFLTGNPVVDAFRWVAENRKVDVPTRKVGKLIVVTAHRRENFGAPLESICRAILKIVARHQDVEVVYAIHPNPNVAGPVREMLGAESRIRLIGPQDYPHFVALVSGCTFVLTDSGGIQEEAPVLGKPVLVLRNETERPEAVEAGAAFLVGTDEDRIVQMADRLLSDPEYYASVAKPRSPFGDGHAAEHIVEILLQRFCNIGDGADRYRMMPTAASPQSRQP
jgi:UDP-N-acetylglucosamine 2-epimerase